MLTRRNQDRNRRGALYEKPTSETDSGMHSLMRVVLSWPDNLLKPSPLMLFKWQLISVHWIELNVFWRGHTLAVSVLNSASFPVPIYPVSLPLNVHMLLLMWWGGLQGFRGQSGSRFSFIAMLTTVHFSLPPDSIVLISSPTRTSHAEDFQEIF